MHRACTYGRTCWGERTRADSPRAHSSVLIDVYGVSGFRVDSRDVSGSHEREKRGGTLAGRRSSD
ncbi:hypothetical protein WN55_04882 [Dufourea novaeangliae]|uniref:Uncharacterized protein n=1 Tax=Dufourea novaeangliae TaxID=178035 RepID=A0A154PM78_DUFNO|nr:hypothetical protein WN55_04882 [Dufourea novaeangliae]